MGIHPELSPTQSQRFAELLVDNYLRSGFAVLPKRQIDVLVFHALERAGVFDGKSNYELSSDLGLTERRIRNLRLDAALRFGEVDREQKLREILRLLFETRSAKAVNDDGLVMFELEDPVLQREFEQAARDAGYFADTSFKNSIVRVHLHVFVASVAQGYPDAGKVISDVLADEAEKVENAESGLASSKGLGARIEFFLEKHENKADFVAKLVSALKPLVGLA